MHTPTFPDRPASNGWDDESEIEDSPPAGARSELLAYSDLSRPAMSEFRVRWASLSADEREHLIRSLVEYAESHVEVNYHRIFREALTDENARVRQKAIEGLWEDDDPALPHVYLGLLQSDPDVDVRAEAAAALQRYAEDRSSESAEPEMLRLIEVLVTIGGETREPALVRRRCIEASGPLAENARVSQLIREAFADDDQTLAAGALRAMGRSRQSRWMPEIERAIESPDAELRFEAAGAAGLLGEPQLVESLATLLDDDDAEVRAAAVGALGKIGGPGAIRVLRRLVESGLIDDDEMIQDALDEAMLSENPIAMAQE